MKDFIFYAPTRVFFGKDKHKEVGSIIKDHGFKKIMMQYGKGSIKKSGLYDSVMDSLRENGIEVVEFGGVEANPKLTSIREAVKLAKETAVEMILAVGGGSVIDSAKYTAAGAVSECDVWDYPTKKSEIEKCLPVGCVLTIAAAGSEMSESAVMTNLEINMKRGKNSDFFRCLFAICNPELTYTVSKYQTACGIVDIMAHTIERYFAPGGSSMEITDRVAEGVLKAVIPAGKAALCDPYSYDSRATLMWASSLSHNDLTGCGRDKVLSAHQLEHALSGQFDEIAHGAGLAVMVPAWARYVYKYDVSRFAAFARNVWDVTEECDEKAAVMGIDRMAQYFKELGMPTRLADFNIKEEHIDRLAELCTFGKTREIASLVNIDYEMAREIFASCL